MNSCEKCGSDVRVCPVCEGSLLQDIHGTWYHNNRSLDRSVGDKGCPWTGTHLDDYQIEYLANTKTGYVRKFRTSCQFCDHFNKRYTHDHDSCGFGCDKTVRAILYSLARMDRCPLYERGGK